MRKIATLIATAALLAGGVASAAPGGGAEAKLAKALEGRAAGEPVRCLNLRQIRSTQIIDGTAILYDVGNTTYVNKPTSGASSLRDGKVMVTEPFGSQLCSIDTVKLYDSGSRMPSGWVGLGEFVPYTKVKDSAAS
ncbi:MAG: hypothetical protein J7499_12095 [Sphingopyxis sp.]|nr:hypothetical protein [Sphingopyxis sp.]